MVFKNTQNSLDVEFSHIINIPLFCQKTTPLHFSATPEECMRLSQRFGLVALKKFACTLFSLPTRQPNIYPLKATFKSDVVYNCVKTLEPFEDHISETVYFTAQESSLEEKEASLESLIFTGEEDIIEFLSPEGDLDAGEIMAQYLSLALNPYPFVEGAQTDSSWTIPEPLQTKEPSSSLKAPTHFPFQNFKILKDKITPFEDS